MPLLTTLIDNFNDGVIGANWGNSYGGVTESGGKAHVPCTTGYAGYQTAYSWTLAGASFYVAVTTVPAASTATEAYASVFVNAPDIATSGVRIGFVINVVTGQLKCSSETAYFDAAAVAITYSSTTHKFLRLREDGTNVYWDTSPDGTTWTNRRTLATPPWVTSSIDTVALDLSAHRDAGVIDETQYDLFNTLNDGAVSTASATFGADTTLTAGAIVSAHADTALTADTALAGGLTMSAHADAALTAEPELMADADSNGIPEVADLSAGDWDLRIEQGSTFVQTYTVTDDGFTWDGWSARAQIRTTATASAQLLLDLTPYLTIDGASVRLVIPATQTQILDRGGVWDLELYQGSTVVRLLNGRVIVSMEVTR
ncbi:hypothetical protein [Streptomyces sp. NPDC058254]|uniref:hypothetical protein n=1 Tax=Streptomyces sp. NPDC058254 TaxID=3346406 RepID=UPI0036F06ED7